MTDDPLGALHFLELKPRYLRFLAVMAAHGGYCQRRHWTAYTGHSNRSAIYFLDRLVDRGYMKRMDFPGPGGFLYRLVSRPVYRALGRESEFISAEPAAVHIAQRLMLLDVVVAHPQAEWFVTPDEKVQLFQDRFGITPADFPQRRLRSRLLADRNRPPVTTYFPTDWPIGVDQGSETRVTFVTLAVGSSTYAFETFLEEHQRLLASLPAWTILAATPAGHFGLAACRAAFDRMYRPKREYPPPDFQATRRRLAMLDPERVRYFQCRWALETGDVAEVSADDLEYYREARTRLLGPSVERQFRLWRAQHTVESRLHREAVEVPRAVLPNPVAEGRGDFQPYPLKANYRQFGDLAGDV